MPHDNRPEEVERILKFAALLETIGDDAESLAHELDDMAKAVEVELTITDTNPDERGEDEVVVTDKEFRLTEKHTKWSALHGSLELEMSVDWVEWDPDFEGVSVDGLSE